MGNTNKLYFDLNGIEVMGSKETRQCETANSLCRSYFNLALLLIAMIAVLTVVLFLPTKAFGLDLAKGLVYDHAYGVKGSQLALMADFKHTNAGEIDTNIMTSLSIVNAKGEVIQTCDYSSVGKSGSYYPIGDIFNQMDCNIFPFPKIINGNIRYALFNKSGIRETDFVYDEIDSAFSYPCRYKGFACHNSDLNKIDIYNAQGFLDASILLPAGINRSSIEFVSIFGDTDLELDNMGYDLYCSSNYNTYYVWKSGLSEFQQIELDITRRKSLRLADGSGVVLISKTETEGVLKCETPKAVFSIDVRNEDSYPGHLLQFDIVGDLISYGSSWFSNKDRSKYYWDLNGNEIECFKNLTVKEGNDPNNYLVYGCDSSNDNSASLSPRLMDLSGNVIKVLPAFEDSSSNPSCGIKKSELGDYSVLSYYGAKESHYLIDKALGITPISSEAASMYKYGSVLGSLPNGQSVYTDHSEYTLFTSDLKKLTFGGYEVVNGCDLTGFSAFQHNLSNNQTIFFAKDSNGKYGAVDVNGKVMIPFEYDAFEDQGDPASTLILLKKNGAWEFFDVNSLDGKLDDPAGSNGSSGNGSGGNASNHPGTSNGGGQSVSQNGTKVSGDPKTLPQTSDDRNIALIPLAISGILALTSLVIFSAYRRRSIRA